MARDTDRMYIEILETVLMATLDPELWKSALQKLAFRTGSAWR
ncbi:transcriptional regulator, partial [Klebsiella pneumoniae]